MIEQPLPEIDFSNQRETDGYIGRVTMATVTTEPQPHDYIGPVTMAYVTENEIERAPSPPPQSPPPPSPPKQTDGYIGPITMAVVTQSEIPKPPSPPPEPIGVTGGVGEISDEDEI